MHIIDQTKETKPPLYLSLKHMAELLEVKHEMMHELQEAQNSLKRYWRGTLVRGTCVASTVKRKAEVV